MSTSTDLVPAGSLVLVTGISGWIGSIVALDLLKQGYLVRGVVRSQAKVDTLIDLYPSDLRPHLSFALVPDVSPTDAYDTGTLDGVSAIVHAVLPIPTDFTADLSVLIDSIVQSDLTLLRSASHHASIRRVVLVSSVSAIGIRAMGGAPSNGELFTEADWSPVTSELAAASVAASQQRRWLSVAAKTLAEKAAWDWVEKEKPHFDIVTVAPPLVIGQGIIRYTQPGQMKTSIGVFYGAMQGGGGDTKGQSFVDVRDLASAVTSALRVKEAGGERFILSAGGYEDADISQLKGGAAYVTEGGAVDEYDSSKAKRVLMFAPRSKKETFEATARYLDSILN